MIETRELLIEFSNAFLYHKDKMISYASKRMSGITDHKIKAEKLVDDMFERIIMPWKFKTLNFRYDNLEKRKSMMILYMQAYVKNSVRVLIIQEMKERQYPRLNEHEMGKQYILAKQIIDKNRSLIK